MRKLFFFTILFANLFGISIIANAENLSLEVGKTYLLSFDEEIQNIHATGNSLDVKILHTIYDDKKQLILTLKTNNDCVLQIKTEKSLYRYNVKSSDVSSKDLMEIDVPPALYVQVDVLGG